MAESALYLGAFLAALLLLSVRQAQGYVSEVLFTIENGLPYQITLDLKKSDIHMKGLPAEDYAGYIELHKFNFIPLSDRWSWDHPNLAETITLDPGESYKGTNSFSGVHINMNFQYHIYYGHKADDHVTGSIENSMNDHLVMSDWYNTITDTHIKIGECEENQYHWVGPLT